MYAFVDRPLAELDPSARLLVWAMRAWVADAGRRACPAARVAGAFAHCNLLSGMQPFLRLMATLNRFGLETLHFRTPSCARLSEDEAILLSLACMAADSRAAEVQATLALLVEDEATGDALLALDALAKAMVAADLAPRWPLPCTGRN